MNEMVSIIQFRSADEVCTHDGPFHADDVVCIALLRMIGFRGKVTRTRDPEYLRIHVGVDVAGSMFDGQFDHHGEHSEKGVCALTKLWTFLKQELVAEDRATAANRFEQLVGDEFRLIAAIDSGSCSNPDDVTHMFSWVSLMNDGTDRGFFRCVEMAEAILNAAWAHAEEWAVTLAEARYALTWDGTPPVLETERAGTKEALHQLGCDAPFFVSPHGSEWAVIQTCPKDKPFNRFGYSRVLPRSWGGLRNAELAAVSGYKSAKFAFNPNGGETVMAFFGDKADAIAAAEEACK